VRVPEPLVVSFVPGVTPGKWARVWNERMRRQPLELRPVEQAEALAAVTSGGSSLAFLRDVPAGDHLGVELHVIPLYRETPVVVAPKDHPAAAFDALTLADLAGETLLDGQGADTVELVAANVGLAIMPQSVARAHSRRDVITRPVVDAPDSGIGLAWRVDDDAELTQTFIGIVRGRTERSSRSS
jgi:DNA-binding transcriptional LysR family regulator